MPGDEQLTASQEHGVVLQEHFMRAAGRQVVQVLLNPEILKHVERGDFVISMRSFQGGLELAHSRGCISSAYVILKPAVHVDRAFFKHLFKSTAYIQALQATSNLIRDGQALRFDNFCLLDLPAVPLPEQRTIANFLDRKTAAIDGLIEKKQRLLALLEEKRAALINQAVTKGLDPNVPMKDSGVPWVGEIPAHWVVHQLRRVLVGIEQGWSPQCHGHPVADEEWGVLKAGCTAGGRFRPEENKSLPKELAPRPALQVRKGDVIVSRASGSRAIVGSAALVGDHMGQLMLSDKLFRLKFDKRRALPGFLAKSLGAHAVRAQIENSISGAEGLANNLPQARLKEVVLACPPVGEQTEISEFVNAVVHRTDVAAHRTCTSVERLREYRQALITAAVTGQIDIPEEAA